MNKILKYVASVFPSKRKRVLSQQDQNDYNHKIDRANAILSLNRALLDAVFPQLRAAKIQWDNKKVHLFFYYDGEISEDDHESLECVATEVISDFPSLALEIDITRCDYPTRIPQSDASNIAFVYSRKEKKPPWAESIPNPF